MEVNSLIPDKRYLTISEVGGLCDVKPHVLRYWEQEFRQLNPAKRRGNRRYYQQKDVLIVKEIKSLLYDQGYTIAGARQCLAERLRALQIPVTLELAVEEKSTDTPPAKTYSKNPIIAEVIADLESLIKELQQL